MGKKKTKKKKKEEKENKVMGKNKYKQFSKMNDKENQK